MYHQPVPLTILVVEDEPDLRDLIAEALTEDGYAVVTSANGREAITCVEERDDQIHLLLIDVQTPGVGASDVVRRLRQRWSTIQVLYMSGRERAEVLRDLDPHDAPFLPKPFGLGTLTERVRQLLVIA